jgi:predicted outer membrane repeat protein
LNDNYASNGGGLYLKTGTLGQAGGVVTLTHNSAITNGGGIYVTGGSLALNDTRIISNTAATGGAIYQANGAANITSSCVVFNSDTAVNVISGTMPLVATGNWWGTVDGPSGAGPGSGDSISSGVNYSDFLTSNNLGCPSRNSGALTFAIAGRVTSSLPLAGVLIQASNGLTTITNASGYYTFTNLAAGTYTVTPVLTNYTFLPITRTVNVPPNQTEQDFAGRVSIPPQQAVYLPIVIK